MGTQRKGAEFRAHFRYGKNIFLEAENFFPQVQVRPLCWRAVAEQDAFFPEAIDGGKVVRQGKSYRCPLCPFRKFARPRRVKDHLQNTTHQSGNSAAVAQSKSVSYRLCLTTTSFGTFSHGLAIFHRSAP